MYDAGQLSHPLVYGILSRMRITQGRYNRIGSAEGIMSNLDRAPEHELLRKPLVLPSRAPVPHALSRRRQCPLICIEVINTRHRLCL